MGVKEWIIKKLEKDVESTAGHIDLETLSEEERNKLFEQFGEGDKNLTLFLKTAYEYGAPSLFCCSGHGTRNPYVVLKVTDESIELLRKVGKVLSKSGVVTTFEDNHVRGRQVTFNSRNNSTEWLKTAAQIMKTPELFDDNNPTIYYHEEIYPSYKPLGFELKKKLLSYLRGDKNKLPIVNYIEENEKLSWELNEDEREEFNKKALQHSKQIENQIPEDKRKEER